MATVPIDHVYRALLAVASGEQPDAPLYEAIHYCAAEGYIDPESGALTEAGNQRLARLQQAYGPPVRPECEADGHGHVTVHHEHWFFLRQATDDTPAVAVAWAVWQGGFEEIRTWPWDEDGLREAQDWCDKHGARWHHSQFPVRPGELATHARIN